MPFLENKGGATMNDVQQRKAARDFAARWKDKPEIFMQAKAIAMA